MVQSGRVIQPSRADNTAREARPAADLRLGSQAQPAHDVLPRLSAMPRLEKVHCRRMGRPLSVSEHMQCPYCSGRCDDIANGQHVRLCDFSLGRDPIHFGLPPETLRECEA